MPIKRALALLVAACTVIVGICGCKSTKQSGSVSSDVFLSDIESLSPIVVDNNPKTDNKKSQSPSNDSSTKGTAGSESVPQSPIPQTAQETVAETPEPTVINEDIPEQEITEVEPKTVITKQSSPLAYDALSAKQKIIYATVLSMAEQMTEGFVELGEYYNTAQNDISVAYRAVLYDCPEIFWLPTQFFISVRETAFSKKVLIAFKYSNGEYNCDYLVKKSERAKCVAELNAVVNKVKAEVEKQKLDSYQSELYIHDYICGVTTYSSESGDLQYTSYGALVLKKAVCEGYARAFALLLRSIEIPCVLVNGESQDQGHMWNMVCLDDNWYYVDVTWDDQSLVLHSYFNATYDMIKSDHALNKKLSDYDIAKLDYSINFNYFYYKTESRDFNYFEHESLIITEDMERLAVGIVAQSKKGVNVAQCTFENGTVLNHYKLTPSTFHTKLNKLLKSSGIVVVSASSIGNYILFSWQTIG